MLMTIPKKITIFKSIKSSCSISRMIQRSSCRIILNPLFNLIRISRHQVNSTKIRITDKKIILGLLFHYNWMYWKKIISQSKWSLLHFKPNLSNRTTEGILKSLILQIQMPPNVVYFINNSKNRNKTKIKAISNCRIKALDHKVKRLLIIIILIKIITLAIQIVLCFRIEQAIT
jgi:hypothetical protein